MKLSEKKILKKKEQILLSAITIVNRRGYDGATMEEIAAEMLMTKGSLYYYFKNKGDLMYQCHKLVLAQATQELEEELQGEGTAEEILRKMVATHINYAVEEKETFNMIIEPKQMFNPEQIEPVLKLRKHYASLFDQVIEKGVSTGEFHVEEPIIVRMIILGAMNWIQQWYRATGRLAKEELKQHFAEYIIKLLK
ncbi:TetR/AcrR family transcriptional regulator [Solibacillus sp. MA9]|uniref:TetR/AcrR family transcriptional regulator n=1 Tax=Solibacillus palustris TaxID=2908203 RepID=A0ABS9U8D7_9BACL|nr:TetR/AcrR family transcriptional regulator [Solibacillus sp. MA9]MCH7320599.1 TetR/AcrR family transcriptional regulator [Solibacillus sp. MA9]